MKTFYLWLLFFSTFVIAQPKLTLDVRLTPNLLSEKSEWLVITGKTITPANWQTQKVTFTAKLLDENYENTYVFRRSELLIPNSKKQFYLYVKKAQATYEIDFFIETITGIIPFIDAETGSLKAVAKKTFKLASGSTLKFLYISSRPYANLHSFEGLTPNNPRTTIKVFSLTPQQLPNHWFGYHFADLVILNSDRPLEIWQQKENRKSLALQKWIYQGGKLLVTPINGFWLSRSRFLKSLWNLDKFSTEDFSKWQQDPISWNLEEKPAAIPFLHPKRVDLGPKGLYWYLKRGSGDVIYVGLDMGRHIKASRQLWRDTILRNHFYFSTRNYSKIGTLKKAKLFKQKEPNFQTLILLIFAYWMLIGPINFYLSSKYKRTIHLLWSIPLLALVFAFGVFFYGYLSKGQGSQGVYLQVFSPLNECFWYEQNHLEIFSGARQLLTVTSETGATMQPFFPNRKKRGLRFEYSQQRNKLSLEFPLNLWETGYFRAENVAIRDRLRVVGNSKGNTLTLKIEKSKNLPIFKAMVINFLYKRLWIIPDNLTGISQQSFSLQAKSLRTLLPHLKKQWQIPPQIQNLFSTLQSVHPTRGLIFFALTTEKKALKVTPDISGVKKLAVITLAVAPGETK